MSVQYINEVYVKGIKHFYRMDNVAADKEYSVNYRNFINTWNIVTRGLHNENIKHLAACMEIFSTEIK